MNIQDFLIEATKSIARDKLDKTQFTKSFIGTVTQIFDNGECFITINGVESKCFIPLNMKHLIAVTDIVVVQDLYNDKTRRIVHGVVKGSGNSGENGGNVGNTIIHIYNIDTNTVVSSVMQVWNEDTNSVVSETFGF